MKIAITGKMCSGKSSIANMIMRLDNTYQIYSYGQKIKDIAVDLFNMKNKDRSLIINIAQQMKNIDENIWVNYLMKQLIGKKNCIIDDLRFQNELDMLDNNWYIIRLHISKQGQLNRINKIYNNADDHIQHINHISENCNNLNFDNRVNIIDINTEKESIDEIKHKLFLLLIKNK